jgi:hypothetical protein
VRPRDVLREVHHVLSRHCDDPLAEMLLHLGQMTGLTTGGGESFRRAVNSGYDLAGMYKDFVRGMWSAVTHRSAAGMSIPDYLGSLTRRVRGDKYQREEFALTPPDVVHERNVVLFPEERRSGSPELRPENIMSVLDPTCGTGRVGMDIVLYYPTAVLWNVERDLETYRVALLNGALLTPFVQASAAGLRCSRWNVLWADSLVVDVRDTQNWERGAGLWNPPDWRTYTTSERTWAELEGATFNRVVRDPTESAQTRRSNMGVVTNVLPQSRTSSTALPTQADAVPPND